LRSLAADLQRQLSEDRKETQLLYYQPNQPAALKIHQSTANILGVGGGNRCLGLNAPVLMADGNWKSLGEIQVGDMVMAADPISGDTAPAGVLKTHRSGQKPLYRVHFSDGGWFEASADHMVPLYLGSGRNTSKGNLKFPHKRRLGDYIEPINRRGKANPSKRISAVSPSDIRIGQTKLPLPPYLLGALIGDGGFTKKIRFFNTDANVLERVHKLLEPLDCYLVHYSDCSYGVTTKYPRDGNPVLDALRDLRLNGKTSHGKFIPSAVFGLDREGRKEFLAGLIDTDGTLNAYSTASEKLADDFVRLIRSLGGHATKKPRRNSAIAGGKLFDSFYVYWRINENLPLSIPSKQRNVHSSRYRDYSRRICRKAELVGEVECGDIEVDHPAHCYITKDHVIVSNSGKTDSILCVSGNNTSNSRCGNRLYRTESRGVSH